MSHANEASLCQSWASCCCNIVASLWHVPGNTSCTTHKKDQAQAQSVALFLAPASSRCVPRIPENYYMRNSFSTDLPWFIDCSRDDVVLIMWQHLRCPVGPHYNPSLLTKRDSPVNRSKNCSKLTVLSQTSFPLRRVVNTKWITASATVLRNEPAVAYFVYSGRQ